MKTLITCLTVLCSSNLYALDYSVTNVETGAVYDQAGALKDSNRWSVSTRLSVNRSDRITVDFQPMEFQMNDGTGLLKMPTDYSEIFARGTIEPEPGSQVSVTRPNSDSLEWTSSGHVLRGSDYERIEKDALDLLNAGELDYAVVLPLALFRDITESCGWHA